MSADTTTRPTARIARLVGLLALPLVAGCAYDDGYYAPSSSYGSYDYYGPGYGYGGGYYYGYGYYGDPCWPYGCRERRHRHRHRHHDWDDDDHDDNHGHRDHDSSWGLSDRRRFDRSAKMPDTPRDVVRPGFDNGGGNRRGEPGSPTIWFPRDREDKKN